MTMNSHIIHNCKAEATTYELYNVFALQINLLMAQ